MQAQRCSTTPADSAGSYSDDLPAFLEASYAIAALPGFADLLSGLMAQAQIDPEFGERFRSDFLIRRRHAFAVITERARTRGDLPAHPTPDTAADIVFGTIWYRILATGQVLEADLVDELIRLLT